MFVEFRTPISPVSSFRSAYRAACTVVVLCLSFTNSANAQFIDGVSIAGVSTELAGFGRFAEDTIDGSGFDEVALTHTTLADNMWLSNGLFAAPNDPLPATPGVDPNPFIIFNLDGVYDLSALSVWNYNESVPDGRTLSDRGAQDVRISAGLTVNSLVPLENGNNGDFVFAQATETDDYAGETFDLTGISTVDAVQVVRFDFFTNHGSAEGFIGLSEVRFTGTDLGFEGDLDLGGEVDLNDFQPISDNIFQTVDTRAEGDLTGDGFVDFFDFREWKDVVDATNPALAAGGHVRQPYWRARAEQRSAPGCRWNGSRLARQTWSWTPFVNRWLQPLRL